MISDIDNAIIAELTRGEDFWSFHEECERDYVHGLFAYPAMMVPKMQREIISIFKENIQARTLTIYDPFMGSGTILVEGMLQGANIIGVDINPLAYLVSTVKTTIYSLERLERSKQQLLERLLKDIPGNSATTFDNIHKWFKADIILQLDHIKQQISLEPSLKMRKYFWVAFSETIRTVSNSRSSTYKLHIKNESDINAYSKSAIDVFRQIVEKNVGSTMAFQAKLQELGFLKYQRSKGWFYSGSVDLILGDTIQKTERICTDFNPVLIVTSPPYGDNHTTVTYGQYSILALRWIPLQDIDKNVDASLIQTLSKIDKISMGGQASLLYDEAILQASPSLQENIEIVRNNDETKVNKVLSFYNDFYVFIDKLKALQPNAYVVMTVGNRRVAKTRIRMDSILIDYFENMQFEFIYKFKRNILNKRMPTVNHKDKLTGEKSETMTKEYVLIFKKR